MAEGGANIYIVGLILLNVVTAVAQLAFGHQNCNQQYFAPIEIPDSISGGIILVDTPVTVTKIGAILTIDGFFGWPQDIVMFLYATGSDGAPTTVLGQTSEFGYGIRGQKYEVPIISPVDIAPGTYVIVISARTRPGGEPAFALADYAPGSRTLLLSTVSRSMDVSDPSGFNLLNTINDEALCAYIIGTPSLISTGSAIGPTITGCTLTSMVLGAGRPQMKFGPFAGINQLSQPGIFTIALWIRPEPMYPLYRGQPLMYITSSDGVSSGWQVSLETIQASPSSYVTFVKFGGVGRLGALVDMVGHITVGAWNHVTVTFDGSHQQLFTSGTLASAASLETPTDFTMAEAVLVINPELDEVWVNEVAIWHRVLAPAEVALAAGGNAHLVSTAQRLTLAYVSAIHGQQVLAYQPDGTLLAITRAFDWVMDSPTLIQDRCDV